MRIVRYIIIILSIILPSALAQAQGNIPVACAGSAVRYGTEGLPNSKFEWSVTGGTIIADYNDSVDILWGNNPGEFSIEVTELSEYQCQGETILAAVSVNSPNIQLDDEINICQGDTETIIATAGFESYQWSDGVTTGRYYDVSTSGTVWVEVVDQYNCSNRDSSLVLVHSLPEVFLGNDTVICGDQTLELDAGVDGIYYRWSTGHMTQTIVVGKGVQSYDVEVRNNNGCVNFDTINILACVTYDKFKREIPTAFTPDGDGVNDKFDIHDIEQYPNVVIEIFDRWGRRVFKSDVGYTIPWDGTFDGQELPMDTYYYIIDLKDGLEPFNGSISIIK